MNIWKALGVLLGITALTSGESTTNDRRVARHFLRGNEPQVPGLEPSKFSAVLDSNPSNSIDSRVLDSVPPCQPVNLLLGLDCSNTQVVQNKLGIVSQAGGQSMRQVRPVYTGVVAIGSASKIVVGFGPTTPESIDADAAAVEALTATGLGPGTNLALIFNVALAQLQAHPITNNHPIVLEIMSDYKNTIGSNANVVTAYNSFVNYVRATYPNNQLKIVGFVVPGADGNDVPFAQSISTDKDAALYPTPPDLLNGITAENNEFCVVPPVATAAPSVPGTSNATGSPTEPEPPPNVVPPILGTGAAIGAIAAMGRYKNVEEEEEEGEPTVEASSNAGANVDADTNVNAEAHDEENTPAPIVSGATVSRSDITPVRALPSKAPGVKHGVKKYPDISIWSGVGQHPEPRDGLHASQQADQTERTRPVTPPPPPPPPPAKKQVVAKKPKTKRKFYINLFPGASQVEMLRVYFGGKKDKDRSWVSSKTEHGEYTYKKLTDNPITRRVPEPVKKYVGRPIETAWFWVLNRVADVSDFLVGGVETIGRVGKKKARKMLKRGDAATSATPPVMPPASVSGPVVPPTEPGLSTSLVFARERERTLTTERERTATPPSSPTAFSSAAPAVPPNKPKRGSISHHKRGGPGGTSA